MSLAVSARSAQFPVFIIKVVVVSLAMRMSAGSLIIHFLIVLVFIAIVKLAFFVLIFVFRGVKALIFLIFIDRRMIAVKRTLDFFLKGSSSIGLFSRLC